MKYQLITYGCQMNKSDSERIAAFLENRGYKPASKENEANLIVVNMCSVRQSAVDRVFGLKPKFKELKGSERIEKAYEIILSYLSTRKSALQVNINAKLIKNVSSNLKLQLETMDGLDDDLFDDALGHVVFSMLSDNYPRFQDHEMFEKMNSQWNT